MSSQESREGVPLTLLRVLHLVLELLSVHVDGQGSSTRCLWVDTCRHRRGVRVGGGVPSTTDHGGRDLKKERTTKRNSRPTLLRESTTQSYYTKESRVCLPVYKQLKQQESKYIHNQLVSCS